jgi:uncharacterized lipoprotein
MPVRLLAILCAALTAAALAGCSRGEGIRCEDPALYSSSTSVPPIRVPDDLSVPDESQSLLIPDASRAPTDAPTAPAECLESPPRYFEENSG